MDRNPLVSVVTPVYNCEEFIAECIESVLRQTYANYEYIIVDNCSTDRTLAIASEYAKKDGRIRVHSNTEFVGVIENHNRAFRLISPTSKYCKVICGDDWLFPECIQRMVELAEAHPSVGIICSYQLSGGAGEWYLRTYGLPYSSSVVPGREICRSHLLGSLSVFGNPTSTLYRADLIRSTDCFYPNSTAEADTSTCFKYLRNADFGFVHQVLSHERIHQASQTATSRNLNRYVSARIGDLLAYGPFYMTKDEVERRLDELLDSYYNYLGDSVFDFRDGEFWSYHRKRLKELGHPLDNLRLGKTVVLKFIDLVLNPKSTVEKFVRRTVGLRSATRQPGAS